MATESACLIRESNVRKAYTAASWIALAAAVSAFSAPASGQQAQPASGPLAPATAPAETPASGEVVTIYGDRERSDPGAYSVIDAKTIEDVGANHPAEILNTVPGVNVQMNSGQELLIGLRSPVLPAGAGQGSFLILENGIPTRAPGFGNVNALFELHHETAEAIEVVRGPGSVRYGSNAVHGLMNFIDPEPGAQTGSHADSLAATRCNAIRADATANFTVNGVANWIGISVMDDGGWRDASGVDQQKLTWRSKFRGETWNAVATIAGRQPQQETAGFIQGFEAYKNEDIAKTNPNPEAYRDASALRANVRFETNIGQDKLVITPFGISQRMTFIQHFLPDQSTEENGQDSLGIMTRYEFGPEDFRWTVGADVQWADGFLTETQTRASFGGADRRQPDFPAGRSLRLRRRNPDGGSLCRSSTGTSRQTGACWRACAANGTHYDYTTHKAPGTYGRFRVAPSRTDKFHLLTPKLGLVYTGFEGAELYANYARGERAPQTSDQYRLQNLQTIQRLRGRNARQL